MVCLKKAIGKSFSKLKDEKICATAYRLSFPGGGESQYAESVVDGEVWGAESTVGGEAANGYTTARQNKIRAPDVDIVLMVNAIE